MDIMVIEGRGGCLIRSYRTANTTGPGKALAS